MDWKFREELGDPLGKITELVDAVGAEVPTMSGGALVKQHLCLGHVLHVDGPQPVILLGLLGSLEKLLQDGAARIEAWLEEGAETGGWMDGHNV